MSIRKSIFTLGLAALATTFIACSDDSSSSGDPTAPINDNPTDSTTVNDSTATNPNNNTNAGPISYQPVTAGATESAQKLYNFLATH